MNDSATSFLEQEELAHVGLGSIGRGVLLSRYAVLHNPGNIHLGDSCRVDDFCLITAGHGEPVNIGNWVHIAAFAALFGQGGLSLGDFSGISSRTTLYSTNDDYSGEHMTNPTVSAEYTGVVKAPVTIGRHVVVGASCVILPGTSIGEGCSIGALSLVRGLLQPWGIYVGVPARHIRERSRRVLELEKQFLCEVGRKGSRGR